MLQIRCIRANRIQGDINIGKPPSTTKLIVLHVSAPAVNHHQTNYLEYSCYLQCLICFTVFMFVLRSQLMYHRKYISQNFYVQNLC
jgi:hypothetical protein